VTRSGAQAGAVIAIAGGVGIVGAPLGGTLTDRIGRRPTLLIALAGAGAGFIAYGALSSLLAVALLSPFWGITSDLESPAISAAIADVVQRNSGPKRSASASRRTTSRSRSGRRPARFCSSPGCRCGPSSSSRALLR
jgi:MFS family permease